MSGRRSILKLGRSGRRRKVGRTANILQKNTPWATNIAGQCFATCPTIRSQKVYDRVVSKASKLFIGESPNIISLPKMISFMLTRVNSELQTSFPAVPLSPQKSRERTAASRGVA